MPIVTAPSRGQSTGEEITEFLDTVGTVPTTYTFQNTQEKLKVKNNGYGSLKVTVNGTLMTLFPTESKEFYGSIDSFVVTSDGGVQSFEVVGSNYKDENYRVEVRTSDPSIPVLGQMWFISNLPPALSSLKAKFASATRLDFQAIYADLENDACTAVKIELDVVGGNFSSPLASATFTNQTDIDAILGADGWRAWLHNANIIDMKYDYRICAKDTGSGVYGPWTKGTAYVYVVPNYSFEDDTNADLLPDSWKETNDSTTATRVFQQITAPTPTLDGLYKAAHGRISSSTVADGTVSLQILQSTAAFDVTANDVVSRLSGFKFGLYPKGSECVKDPAFTNGYYIQIRAYFRDAASAILATRTATLLKVSATLSSNYDLSTGVLMDAWNDIAWDLKQAAIDGALDVTAATLIKKVSFDVRFAVLSGGTTSCGGYLDAFRL